MYMRKFAEKNFWKFENWREWFFQKRDFHYFCKSTEIFRDFFKKFGTIGILSSLAISMWNMGSGQTSCKIRYFENRFHFLEFFNFFRISTVRWHSWLMILSKIELKSCCEPLTIHFEPFHVDIEGMSAKKSEIFKVEQREKADYSLVKPIFWFSLLK